MKILEVIHGYPPLYNAGSEIYTQTISRELIEKGHAVAVFTREEDPYKKDFDIRVGHDQVEPLIRLYSVNHARSRDRYRNEKMDAAFAQVLDIEKPDIVHIGHLNHLSTGIPGIAAQRAIPVVFTFHDFWLACPRGQFLQMCLGEEEIWRLCPGQDNKRCAVHCMSRIWGGVPANEDEDVGQWIRWIEQRMEEIQRQIDFIDLFIAPSRHIMQRMIEELNIDQRKVIFEPYGFDLTRLENRVRTKGTDFCFGYIGRIAPAKGVDLLIKAFGKTKGNAQLRIWGRETADVRYLKMMVEDLPDDRKERVQWLPEYRNEEIVTSVFNNVDAIVVPSIWDENSPLVIQEAQQAKVPVITADHAGMSELVKHEINGLLFKHRDMEDLALKLQSAIDKSEELVEMGNSGCINSQDGTIHSIEKHINVLNDLFADLIKTRSEVCSHVI